MKLITAFLVQTFSVLAAFHAPAVLSVENEIVSNERADKNAYLRFFENYLSLSEQFDPAVADLYADSAAISTLRKLEDGTSKTLQLDGKQWKQLIVNSMPTAKQRGDRSEFENIDIELSELGATITASRYSVLKCYTDPNYYLLANQQHDGEIRIYAEYSETLAVSQCAEVPPTDLPLLLQGTVKTLNTQLPTMVDAETKIEKSTADGNTVTLHHILVNYNADELDATAIEKNLKATVINQTCTLSSLKSIVNQGGSITYRYSGKDKVLVADVVVDKTACE